MRTYFLHQSRYALNGSRANSPKGPPPKKHPFHFPGVEPSHRILIDVDHADVVEVLNRLDPIELRQIP